MNQAANWMTLHVVRLFLCAAYEDISIDRLFAIIVLYLLHHIQLG